MGNSVAAIVSNDWAERFVNKCFVLHHVIDDPFLISRQSHAHEVTKPVHRVDILYPHLSGQRFLPAGVVLMRQ